MTKRVKRTLIRLSLIASCALTCLFSVGVTAAAESAEPTLSVNHFNLSFRDNVCVKYAVETNVEDLKLLVWREVSDDYTKGTEEEVLETVGVQVIEEKEHQIFDYTQLYAKNMTEDVYARAYAVVDGVEYYSPVKKYSILQYAYNKLGKTDVATTDEELKATLTQMLEYGAAVQNYLDYRLDRLPTDNFVQVKLSGGTLPDGFSEGLYKVGDAVVITAPETNNEGYVFEQWVDKDNTVVSETAIYALPVGEENNTYTPLYKRTSQGLTFVSNGDGTCSVTGIGTCTDTELVIPSASPEGDRVTGIRYNAFNRCSSLTSVEIPNGVASIGSAFYGCSGLESIAVESGNPVFHVDGNCLIETATDTVIAGCKTSVIPNYAKNIGERAFGQCTDLESIHLPEHVTSIGNNAFVRCSNLKTVTIQGNVTDVGDRAFSECSSLESIELPNTVKNIDAYAFSSCTNLKTVSFGENSQLENLGSNAFRKCSSLESIELPSKITSISSATFYSCSNLKTVQLPSGVTDVESSAFSGCGSLESIEFPTTVQTLGNWAFRDCSSLESVTIPSSVMNIGSFAFTKCSGLKTVSFGENSNLENVSDHAFQSCSVLETVTIPNTVTSIGEYAFYFSNAITTVYYGGTSEQWSAISLDDFSNAPLLNATRYDYSETEPALNSDGTAYDGNYWRYVDGEIVEWVYVKPAGTEGLEYTLESSGTSYSVTKYTGTATDVVIPETYNELPVTKLGSYLFDSRSDLTSVQIPDSVTIIAYRAFYGCEGLTSIQLPNNLTTIGSDGFRRCYYLTEIVLPESVTGIGSSAFSYCSRLKSIRIPSKLKIIDINLFEGCSKLESVIIGESVTDIYGYAFHECSSLKSIEIPDSVIRIEDEAFRGCSSLENATIGDGVVTIGDYTFYGCSSLASVTIGDSVITIGNRAFYGCSSLTSVAFKDMATWYRTESNSYTGGSSISVINPSDNATYLSSTYCNYYWYKK